MKFQKMLIVLSVAIAVSAIGLMGCNKPSDTSAGNAADGTAASAASTIPPELEKYKDVIQKLPESEWAAVYKQKVCPVSEEPLGSMGTPIKVTVKGHDVYICCEGCRKALEDEPDKYLKKIEE